VFRGAIPIDCAKSGDCICLAWVIVEGGGRGRRPFGRMNRPSGLRSRRGWKGFPTFGPTLRPIAARDLPRDNRRPQLPLRQIVRRVNLVIVHKCEQVIALLLKRICDRFLHQITSRFRERSRRTVLQSATPSGASPPPARRTSGSNQAHTERLINVLRPRPITPSMASLPQRYIQLPTLNTYEGGRASTRRLRP